MPIGYRVVAKTTREGIRRMPMEKAVWDQAMTLDQYKEQMTRNREQFEANEQKVELTEDDLAFFRKGPKQKVAVLTEDWCGDAIAYVPVLTRIAAETGKFDFRFFLRDQTPEMMAHNMNGEFKSIPVLAFISDEYEQVDRFIERPKTVTEARGKKRKEIYGSDSRYGSESEPIDNLPEDVRAELGAKLQKMREELQPMARKEMVRELREIVSRLS